MFTKCYLRICSQKFDLFDIKNFAKHLTNFTLNKQNFNTQLEDSVCDSDTFDSYLYWYKKKSYYKDIKPKIQSIINETLMSVSLSIE